MAPEQLGWAVGAWAEGWGMRAVARVFEVAPTTVRPWGVEVADHLKAFSPYFLPAVRLTQVPVDELFVLRSAGKEGERSEAAAITRLARSPQGGWAAIDPVTQLLRTLDVGERTLARAQRGVHQVVQGLAPGCVPLFLSDGCTEYATALLTHGGQGVQPPRRHDQGPHPKSRWMPRPQLLSAQVVKTVRRRRLGRVSPRVVFGPRSAVQQGLAGHGWQSNTAFLERVNLTSRQHVAAVGRRVSTLGKGEAGWRQQWALYHTSSNFGFPHARLCQALPPPEPPQGTGSATQWRPPTPARAAGVTARVGSLREVLLCRGPPWPQPAGV